MTHSLYTYRATITSVYDGDSVTADIDLGFRHVMHGQKLRLFGIDTPEIRGEERPEGLKARDRLRGLILDRGVIIETVRDRTGKYGRWLATVWAEVEPGSWENINHLLVAEGLAETYISR